MKLKKYNLLWFILIVCNVISFQLSAQNKEVPIKIHQLLNEKQYFKARNAFHRQAHLLTAKPKLELEAILAYHFNKPKVSNKKIDSLFNNNQLSDSLAYKLLQIKIKNEARLFNYQNASELTQLILEKYTYLMDSLKHKDYQNTLQLWSSLARQPRQKIIKNGRTTVKITIDKAKLMTIPIHVDNTAVNFVFDTGANLSTVTESMAKKLNMKILPGAPVKITSGTGSIVNAQMAICPKFYLGNVMIKNAAFIVLPDDALSFPTINYQIKGIIGFPIIEALGEIRITRDGKMIIPTQETTTNDYNLALDFLTIILNINKEPYVFDSGASETFLYPNFYKKHLDLYEKKYKPHKVAFASAGGKVNHFGISAPVKLVISGKTVKLDSATILMNDIDSDRNYYFGNIGQDVIKKFDLMIINFNQMFLKFE